MHPGVTYTLARIGIFIACALPALFLLPREMNVLLKLMIAVVVSAGISFFALRDLRDKVATRMMQNAQRRAREKERLRAALAGEDDPTEKSAPTDR